MSFKTVELLAEISAVYCPNGYEACRILRNCPEDQCFYGIGEESETEYKVPYSDVNLDDDMFYKLIPVGPEDLDD